MVRVDHEDGGVLNPDDKSAKTEPVVVKRSPLRRKPQRAASADGAAAPAEVPESIEAVPTAEAAPPDEAGEAGEVLAAAGAEGPAIAESTEPGAPDQVAGSGVAYRDRRLGAPQRRTAAEAAGARRAPRAGVWRVIAVAAGAVVLIAGLVGSFVFAAGLQRAAHERDLRAEYTAFARQVVVQMTTLDAENADAMYELAMKQTSGRAQQVFKENMKTVAEMIRQADAVTKTTVLTEAVSEADDTEGTVLMVIGWESRDKAGKQEPMYQTFRFRVGMTRINDELKATDLEFVW